MTYTVGGTISGLSSSVVLRNNGAGDLTVGANGAFSFGAMLASGSAYNVTVQTQPSLPAQTCEVSNGSGSITTANVTDVTVVCTNLPVAILQADARVRGATLDWTSPADAASFNAYVSSAPDCDIRNFTNCPDGASFTNVTSPHKVANLHNGQPYFFQIETVFANGAHGLSNQAGTRPDALGFNGAVVAIAHAADGSVYIGGSFTRAGIVAGSGVPLDAGTARFAMPDFPIVNDRVLAIAADGAGGWYIGGFFTQVGNVPRHKLAHILANGVVDPDFNPGPAHPNTRFSFVAALAVVGDKIYVGGEFATIGGEARQDLALVDASGAVLPWNPNADSNDQIPNSVRALVASGNTIYAGGDFSVAGGWFRDRLQAMDTNGTILPWNPGADGPVHALAIADGVLYVGGTFANVGNASRSNLAAIRADNGEVAPWNPSADQSVFALALSGAGAATTIYVGGQFRAVGGTARNRLAAIDTNGALQTWDPNAGDEPGDFVSALAASGSAVYIAGNFTAIGSAPRNHLAAVDANGGGVLPWSPNADRFANAVAVSGNTVYVGGGFGVLGGIARNFLAALDASGNLLPWDPRPDGFVRTLAVSGNTVYAGGDFVSIGNSQRARLAAIDTAGTVLGWNPGADNEVRKLVVADNTIYAGGRFTTLGNQARNRIAAIDTGGATLPWDPNINGTVDALAVSGTTVYAGGSFTSVGGAPRGNLAAIAASGAPLQWNPLANASVAALVVSGNAIYAGGQFTNVANTPRNALAAIAADGALLNWNPNAGAGGGVAGVDTLVASGSTIYAGGLFSTIGATPRNNLAAISAIGAGALLPWNPRAEGAVAALEIAGDTIHVGGSFKTLDSLPSIAFGTVNATGEGDAVP